MHKILVLLLFCTAVLQGKDFVEGKLTGQIGNQMFVIAAATSLALDHNAIAVFPGLVCDSTNGVPFNFKHVFYHLNTQKPGKIRYKYWEPSFSYTPIRYKKNMQIQGYFQSEKYFAHHKKEILELFKPHPEIRIYLEKKYKKLLEHPNLVSFHMRFYNDHNDEAKTYLRCREDFFAKASGLFAEDALFVVFSNKMEECKRLLASSNHKCVFIENESYHHDLYLMSMCRHNIISNSTFSWWGAYLNSNPNKIVVAPARWFTEESGLDNKDLMPSEWIKI